MANQNKD